MAAPRSGKLYNPFICRSCQQRLLASPRRHFTTAPTLHAEDAWKSKDGALFGLSNLSNQMRITQNRRKGFNDAVAPGAITAALDNPPDVDSFLTPEFHNNYETSQMEQPHRMHIYAHKHNTHITLVQPARSAADTAHLRTAGSKTSATEQKKIVDTLLSISTGNIGFKKAGRGSYDAAFQLAAFALKQIQERGIQRDIRKLEVVLRGFGAGREAVTKALLGTEGRNIRGKISSVVDATRLKQGGPRSKKPRRLG